MKQLMKTIKTLAIIIFPVLMVSSCSSWVTDPSNRTGSVEVTISLQGVGQLSKISEIDLSDLYIEMTSGSSVVSDTISVTGNSQVIVSKTYTDLTPGEWIMTAETLDDKDSTIHEGSTTFTVTADQTTEVGLDLTSNYSMLTANFVAVADSVSRLELLVNSTIVADTSFTQGSKAGDTVSLEYDYLVSGESHTLELAAYGSMWGTYQLLYTGDTTITVIAGVDISYTVSLVYVGPAEAPGGNASVIITLGRSGRVTVNGNFPNESDGTMTDIDGNVYTTITIGDQVWMAENLQVTHYRNGDPIPNVTDATEWINLTTGAYCEYDNNSVNVATYGRLYNWYAVTDSRNLAPAGWHVPTDDEWKELEMALGMSQDEADATMWRGSNEGSQLAGHSDLWYDDILDSDPAFSTSGFKAVPGGYRGDLNGGSYEFLGYYAYFWTANNFDSYHAWHRHLRYDNLRIDRNTNRKPIGFSVRCVRD